MNKNTRKSVRFRSKKVKSFFTGSRLTKYAGLSPIMQYIEKCGIDSSLNSLFPTMGYNSLKFSKAQILLSIILSSLSGVSHIVKIANFTKDCLVTSLLNLKKCINKDAISTLLKKLGQAGAFRLQEYLWRQEHETFRDWFINLPAKLVKGGRVITAKLYKHYYYKDIWIGFEKVLLA